MAVLERKQWPKLTRPIVEPDVFLYDATVFMYALSVSGKLLCD